MILTSNGNVACMLFLTQSDGKCLLTTNQQTLLDQLSFQLGIHDSPVFQSWVEVLLQGQSRPFRCDDFISQQNPYGTNLLILELHAVAETFPQISPMLWRTMAHLITWPSHESSTVMVRRGPYTYPMMQSLIFSLIHTTELYKHVQCAFMREGCFAVISPDTLVCTRTSVSVSFIDTPRSIRPQEAESISIEWLKNLIIGLFVRVSLSQEDQSAVLTVRPNGAH